MTLPNHPRIAWIKTPGSIATISAVVGAGIYARSSDGRFFIWVQRHRFGRAGQRSYGYTFSATDYRTPSHGRPYTTILIPDTAQSSAIKTMVAVERYAARPHGLSE